MASNIYKTELCPDALEPLLWDDKWLLACCNYYLDKETNKKSGSILLLNPSKNSDSLTLGTDFRLQTDAIFHGRWVRQSEQPMFISCTSTGSLHLYDLTFEGGRKELSEKHSVHVPSTDDSSNDSEASLLYVDTVHNQEADGSNAMSFVTSRSDGRVSLVALTPTGLEPVLHWNAHNLGGCPIEVWVAVVNNSNPNVVWTGGDDSCLRGWDVRENMYSPLFVNKKHGAGVTSVSWCPYSGKEHYVLTGSYDNAFRIWDDRNMAQPLGEYDCGGGVWRQRWYPKETEKMGLVATSCMYNGSQILDVRSAIGLPSYEVSLDSEGTTSTSIRLVKHYKNHNSIVYGSDWLSFNTISSSSEDDASEKDGPDYLVSCSFYENEVHYWPLKD